MTAEWHEKRHLKSTGQEQTLCDLYITMLRSIIEVQNHQIADLERRVAGEPLTELWINGVLQK